MTKLAVILVMVLVVLISLTACGAPHQGIITNKAHYEGYYYTTNICAGYSKEGFCTVWVPVTNYNPPSWQFDLKDGDDHGWRAVTEETFNQYNVGDHFSDGSK